ncbi:MAG: hypothetical protein AAF368_01395, partial [Planctomycetota bacterium]
ALVVRAHLSPRILDSQNLEHIASLCTARLRTETTISLRPLTFKVHHVLSARGQAVCTLLSESRLRMRRARESARR